MSILCLLGGAELPLLLDAAMPDAVALLATTRLHVEAAPRDLQVEAGA
jgi:hypothetical protein